MGFKTTSLSGRNCFRNSGATTSDQCRVRTCPACTDSDPQCSTPPSVHPACSERLPISNRHPRPLRDTPNGRRLIAVHSNPATTLYRAFRRYAHIPSLKLHLSGSGYLHSRHLRVLIRWSVTARRRPLPVIVFPYRLALVRHSSE